jgi:hypothetical protein
MALVLGAGWGGWKEAKTQLGSGFCPTLGGSSSLYRGWIFPVLANPPAGLAAWLSKGAYKGQSPYLTSSKPRSRLFFHLGSLRPPERLGKLGVGGEPTRNLWLSGHRERRDIEMEPPPS